jgi:hypothetical protein
MLIIWLAIVILFIASFWKIFTKAGEPGWACLVPIYNAIVFLRIAGKPWWWLLLFLIPLVNLVIMIMVTISFAKAFGKDVGYAIGLIFLGFIFYPMLAFGDATYTKPE